MLVSKLYAATMAAGAPEPPEPRPDQAARTPRERRPPGSLPPRDGVPRLRVRRGPRGTVRLSVVTEQAST